ncbi:MBL fold metallo-hydrolase [Actinomadura roseirufa]|uniref:MBL fold metallo-hydrolase n=1 Tax=Actinomadura roseirufa TaxID=2094049 RepID=UPI001F5E572B|nr:MBL fold metallo-hydrolase [Actinomadura roseirufa]
MHEDSQIVSGVEVVPLHDAIGPMGPSLRRPLPETFPGSTPALWERLRAEAPEVFGPDGAWVLRFYCFLVRVPQGPTILVDTGLGPEDSPASSWAPVPGGLIGALSGVGLAPSDIDIVVLTHVHSDHASGAVAGGVPVFGNARHVLQRDELDWLRNGGGAVLDEVVQPLQDAGLLDTITGGERLSDSVAIALTPGHTPGHQSVIVDDHRLVVAGDIVMHPAQLADPSITYIYDEDPVAAAATRIDLLARMRDRDGILAAPHLPQPFVPITRA